MSNLDKKLLTAIEVNDAPQCARLIAQGARLDKQLPLPSRPDNSYGTLFPLSHAVNRDLKDIVQLFINEGADVNQQSGLVDRLPLHYARSCAVAQLLLDAGADPNAEERNDGVTPIFYAAKLGSIELIDTLITAGADLEHTTFSGLRPIYYASSRATVLHLQARGADVVTPLRDGTTLYRYAKKLSTKEVADALVECGTPTS